jgi:hypothetical protein
MVGSMLYKIIKKIDFIYGLDKFDDIKEVIRICKSRKDRQNNCQKKAYKKANTDLQNITQKRLSNINHSKNKGHTLVL